MLKSTPDLYVGAGTKCSSKCSSKGVCAGRLPHRLNNAQTEQHHCLEVGDSGGEIEYGDSGGEVILAER